MDNFKEKFETILIRQLGVSQEDLKPEAKFTDDLGADSLDVVELIMELESEFKIAIPDNEADKMRTIGDAENFLRKELDMELQND